MWFVLEFTRLWAAASLLSVGICVYPENSCPSLGFPVDILPGFPFLEFLVWGGVSPSATIRHVLLTPLTNNYRVIRSSWSFFSPVPSCPQQALPVGRLWTQSVTSQNIAMDPLATVSLTPSQWMAICAGWGLRTATTDSAKLWMTSVSAYLEKVLLSFVFVLHLDGSVEYILHAIERA